MSANAYQNGFSIVGNDLFGINTATQVDKFNGAKFVVDNMHLRTVIRNVPTTVALDGNASSTLDLDVYTVVCVRDVLAEEMTGDLETMLAAWKAWQRRAIAMDPIGSVTALGAGIPVTQTNAGTTALTQAIGDTLWDNQFFCKYFKIVKAQKVQLPLGDVFEIHHHVKGPKTISVNQLQNTGGLEKYLCAKAGVTCGHIINHNGRYYTNGGGAKTYSQSAILVESYCRYSVKPVDSTTSSGTTLDFRLNNL